MKCFRVIFRMSLLLAAATGFSQAGKPSERIVFVRPDPIDHGDGGIGKHLSADVVGRRHQFGR